MISTQDSKTIDAMQSDQALDIIQSAIIADCDAEKPHARNSKGNEVKAESFEPLVTSLDPMVRKTAFINFYYQYYLRKNTFSALLYVLNYRATQKAKMYNFVNDIQ
ncbi:MAG: hypothetical protein MJ201_01400 [Mycoplasmoidaceae bacterium]|nr:hypothetical protein [Mycoplasmoidaceae bacterium]